MIEKYSRRNVIATAAAGVTLSAVGGFPGKAEGQVDQGGAKPRTLRWGIIGTGTHGALVHIPVVKEAPESHLAALCDVCPKRLASAESKVGHDVQKYDNYQELLANPDINAIVIATPNLFHREMTLAAIAAGKHVLCEMPAGVTTEDLSAIRQAAASSKSVVMFGMQFRNDARQKKIHELIASGEVGEPRYIIQNCCRGDWRSNAWQYTDPQIGDKPVNWRFSHVASGGTLNESQGHYFDLLHWFAGTWPERLSATAGRSAYQDGRTTLDHATVTLKYPNDLTAVHTFCLFGPSHNEARIMGTKGAISDCRGEPIRLSRFTRRGAGSTRVHDIHVDEPAKHATLGLYHDFLECVKSGKSHEENIDRACAASRTCWLADLAAHCRAEFRWSA